ncbi:MAG: SurA N-terminal domain-containing protein [Clostridiales Family XIII bacterium]|nr:SurA N-terminal domain-containing protein [Clostridiales Family XIII bacterium]
MKLSKKTKILLCAGLVVVAVAAVVLFGMTGRTAAIVNGTKIPESSVTDNIEAIRANYPNDTWTATLETSGFTPESLREAMISDLIAEILIAQYATEQGFVADETAVAEQFAAEREPYPEKDDWKDYLLRNGFSNEKVFREYLINTNLSAQVSATLTDENADATEALSALTEKLRAEAEIEIKPMPKHLPYVPEVSTAE